MKTLLILVVLLSSRLVCGQVNYSIDSTSIWVQKEEYGGEFSWWTYRYYLSIEDTIVVNDTSYFKLLLNGYETYVEHGFDTKVTYFTDLYYGAIRSDSGKLLLVLPDSDHSITLYDFNLDVGDTIHSVMGKNKTITEIDTLPDNRRKYITNDYEFFLVEGIGSNFGLYNVEHLFPNVLWLQNQKLGCYYQNDTIVFLYDQQVCSYYTPVGIDDIQVNNHYKILSITYYDLLGREILEPKRGFFIERKVTDKGIISKKYFRQ